MKVPNVFSTELPEFFTVPPSLLTNEDIQGAKNTAAKFQLRWRVIAAILAASAICMLGLSLKTGENVFLASGLLTFIFAVITFLNFSTALDDFQPISGSQAREILQWAKDHAAVEVYRKIIATKRDFYAGDYRALNYLRVCIESERRAETTKKENLKSLQSLKEITNE